MNELTSFTEANFGTIRVVFKDGDPWFVAKDLLKVLDYAESSNPSKVLGLVPDEWKGVNQIHTLGGEQDMVILSEQGMYFFLSRSDKPKALPFQKWLAGTVLPSIRKTGSYSAAPALPQSYAEALRALADTVEEKERIAHERDEAIRTKAQIGSKREATAMSKAGVLARKVNTLEEQLGMGTTWKMVPGISWITELFGRKPPYGLIGKVLTAVSKDMGYEIRRVPKANRPNGEGLYHIDVIDETYKRLVSGAETRQNIQAHIKRGKDE